MLPAGFTAVHMLNELGEGPTACAQVPFEVIGPGRHGHHICSFVFRYTSFVIVLSIGTVWDGPVKTLH